MSAIAGCHWVDAPAAVDDLHPAIACAAHRARAPFRCWAGGPVALAAAPAPPYYDPVTRTVTIVDGIIDNLAATADALGLGAERSAAAVVRAACARWGPAAGSRLIGDYVVIVYDERSRRTLAIRDPMGQRPLFYGICRRGIVFGSEAQQVVRHPSMRREIHEPMVAEALTDAPVTLHETLWRDVYRVPPAHALQIDATGSRVERYWDFDPSARVRHRQADGYADEFHALFTDAVACRVPDAGVGVLLSGGVDSSSIAGVAHAIRARRSQPPPHAFTATFPGRPCDETAFADAVVEKWRLPSTRIEVVLSAAASLAAESERYLDLPIAPGRTADVLRRRAAEMEISTLLTGCGGDDFFSGSPLELMTMVRAGRVPAAARALAGSLLGDRARAWLRPVFGARPPKRAWIRDELVRRTHLEERLRAQPAPPFPTREQRDIYSIVRGVSQVLGDELEDRGAHAAGVVQRHPFYDRRVAEFGLALPASQRMRGGVHKIVVRRGLRDYLPEVVARRRDKAEFSFTYVEAFDALDAARIFTHLRSEEAGWVDGAVVRRMYDEMRGLYTRGDGAYIGLTGPLWTVLALEIWLSRV